jgi:protein-disulfide isomerase
MLGFSSLPSTNSRPDADVVSGLTIQIAGLPTLGTDNASIAIVEFLDFECPFCRVFEKETFSRIQRDFVEPGRVRYLWAQYPIETIHQSAFRAAEAALCAHDQGRFLQMRTRLFANTSRLGGTDLMNHAGVIGLDVGRFKTCISVGKAETIRRDVELAKASGVRATPTFLVGYLESGGQMRVVRRIRGNASYSDFQKVMGGL